jgi:FKBP-type peptidyl-prolyl cis-trans isomerase FkpA/FKBP-type peptidyl-prolyl cis-trans isomerase FklB
MWTIVALIACLVLGAPVGAAGQGPELQTEEQKTLYALGLMMSQSLRNYGLTQAELEIVQAGLADGAMRRPRKVDVQAYQPKVRQLQADRMRKRGEEERKSSQAFLAKAATEPGATKTASGLIITTVQPGTGPAPAAGDRVKVHYTGKLIDGTTFDSSAGRGEPATFPLNGVIKCWSEALQLMKVGGKSKLVCPPELAYGDRGAPPRIGPGATLLFDVELIEIVK